MFEDSIAAFAHINVRVKLVGLDLLPCINLNGIWLCLPVALFASEYLSLPKIKQTEMT